MLLQPGSPSGSAILNVHRNVCGRCTTAASFEQMVVLLVICLRPHISWWSAQSVFIRIGWPLFLNVGAGCIKLVDIWVGGTPNMIVKLFQSVHSEQLLPEHARDLLQVFLLPGKLNVDEEVQMKYLRTKHALSAANTQWTNDANLEPGN